MRSIAYLSIMSMVGLSTQMPIHSGESVNVQQFGDFGPEYVFERFPEFSDANAKNVVVVYYPAESLEVDKNDLDDDTKVLTHAVEKREIGEENGVDGGLIYGVEGAEKGDVVSSANGRKRIRFPPAFHG